MPFTFSHPALVLPLTYLPKKWHSLTGLVIGSLTPDFEYFIRMKVQANYGHTLAGIIYFDLPLGILLAFIFHDLIRDSLYINLPRCLKVRLTQFQGFDWNSFFIKNFSLIVMSILTGAASHLLWDSFTHKSGYFAGTLPFLISPINLLGQHIPFYNILQHSGTLIGGIIIFYSFYHLPSGIEYVNHIDRRYWGVLILLILIILIIRLLTGLNLRLYGQVIVTIISAIIISLTITPILVKKKK